jgi:hypothetical protein
MRKTRLVFAVCGMQLLPFPLRICRNAGMRRGFLYWISRRRFTPAATDQIFWMRRRIQYNDRKILMTDFGYDFYLDVNFNENLVAQVE